MGYQNLGYKTGVYTHQITTRESIDKYGIAAADIDYWDLLYSRPIVDLDKIIEIGTKLDFMKYVGIAKILKAYTYSVMVDIWGDIPFSEVNNPDINFPVFDDDEAIYTAVFAMIDEGIADLNNATSVNGTSPDTDDLIYGGNVAKWTKAANTLKLKLYNQIRKTSMFSASAVTTLLAGDLIEEGDDFMMWFGTADSPENRNPGMADEYSGAQISTYISPWFFEILKGENANIFNGIEDPRIPYYFCNQSGGNTENDPEYMNGEFVSIYFGSDGTNRDHAGRSTFTMIGFYPCGGRYDDGKFEDPTTKKDEQLKGGDATGNAPMRFITYADRLFIEAELASQKSIGSNTRTLFKNAVTASFSLIDHIATAAATKQTIPKLTGTTAVTDYIAAVLAKFDAGDAEKQFEIIMTQKWIQSWGSNIDSYTDYRRTGYPILFNANSNGGNQSGGPDGSGLVPTSNSRAYVVAFPYANTELETNSSAPDQRNITTGKVFWDID
jgi:uncharacterized protein YjlB